MKFSTWLSLGRAIGVCLLVVVACSWGLSDAFARGGRGMGGAFPPRGIPGAPAATQPDLKVIQTQHYTIHSDADDEYLAEEWVRLDRLYEEYALRTAALGRNNTEHLPIYMYAQREDYLAAGGDGKSSGLFVHPNNGNARLLINAQDDSDAAQQTLQHEGLHQYLYARLGDNSPPWVSEGLACYFEEALFTGDSYVLGIKGKRYPELQTLLSQHEYKPAAEIAALTAKQWRGKLATPYTAQAWSMIYFLYEGKSTHRGTFDRYLRLLGAGTNAAEAWKLTFGPGTADFDKAWLDFWTTQVASNTDPRPIEARALTFVSFASRAKAAGLEEFKDAEPFFAAADKGFTLKRDAQHWLPADLLKTALQARDLGVTSWELKWVNKAPEFTAHLDESQGGGTIVAGFQKVDGYWRTSATVNSAKSADTPGGPAAISGAAKSVVVP